MDENAVERRLAAILVADVVGYSRLMEADEAGTLAALKERRIAILEPVVKVHRGRVVKFMGDGVLVEFTSAVNAVKAALALQEKFAAANESVEAGRRVVLRIGINLGDIIGEGSDIYGDGVNIAARLEALAEPGGICLSGKVHDEVKGKVRTAFDDLGERQLKNIAAPVRAVRIAGTAGGVSRSPPPAIERPIIAVLPFENIGGDPEQQYFSDGITEDVITELGRFRDLSVIARQSAFALRGKPLNLADVARQLGANYLVEGSVRKAGNRLRITAKLADVASGAQSWAERYDCDLAGIFEVQDALVGTIAATVSGRIEDDLKQRAKRLTDSGQRAYDLHLRAAALRDQNTRASYAKARDLLERATALDPGFAPAQHHLSLVKYYEWMLYWVTDRDRSFADAMAAARRAIALDDGNARFHAHFGMLLWYAGDFDEAASHIEKAVALNPSDANTRAMYGAFLNAAGRVDEAFAAFDEAARLNPLHPNWINWLRGIACFTARRYRDAVRLLKTITVPMNEVHGWLAASYGYLGEEERARASLDEFLKGAETEMQSPPGRSLGAWREYWRTAIPYQRDADHEHLLDGLRKAGFPE